MVRRSSFAFFAVVLLGAFTASLCSAQETEQPPPEKVSQYMRAKLAYSQRILEALALEDYDQLEKDAQGLRLLSQESLWNVMQTEQYVERSQDFRRRTSALSEAAKAKNLDGAALAFVEISLNCVQCHKYVRSARAAKK